MSKDNKKINALQGVDIEKLDPHADYMVVRNECPSYILTGAPPPKGLEVVDDTNAEAFHAFVEDLVYTGVPDEDFDRAMKASAAQLGIEILSLADGVMLAKLQSRDQHDLFIDEVEAPFATFHFEYSDLLLYQNNALLDKVEKDTQQNVDPQRRAQSEGQKFYAFIRNLKGEDGVLSMEFSAAVTGLSDQTFNVVLDDVIARNNLKVVDQFDGAVTIEVSDDQVIPKLREELATTFQILVMSDFAYEQIKQDYMEFKRAESESFEVEQNNIALLHS